MAKSNWNQQDHDDFSERMNDPGEQPVMAYNIQLHMPQNPGPGQNRQRAPSRLARPHINQQVPHPSNQPYQMPQQNPNPYQNQSYHNSTPPEANYAPISHVTSGTQTTQNTSSSSRNAKSRSRQTLNDGLGSKSHSKNTSSDSLIKSKSNSAQKLAMTGKYGKGHHSRNQSGSRTPNPGPAQNGFYNNYQGVPDQRGYDSTVQQATQRLLQQPRNDNRHDLMSTSCHGGYYPGTVPSSMPRSPNPGLAPRPNCHERVRSDGLIDFKNYRNNDDRQHFQ